MRHSDLTLNHRLETYVYANALARTGASGFVPGDVGRIAYQSDTGEYWRLTATTPAWALIALPSTATFQHAAYQTPTGTTSATGTMAGLGSAAWGTAVITPVRSGKVFIAIAGSLNNTSTGGAQAAIRYGTSAAPLNGDPVIGTALGGVAGRGGVGANVTIPFALSGIATGLILGTPVWLDAVVVCTGAAGTASLVVTTITAFELP